MLRSEYFDVAHHLHRLKPNDETGTVSQKTLFTEMVNRLADELWHYINSGEASTSGSIDIRGFRDLAHGVRDTVPRRS